MSSWIAEWATKKRKIAERLASGECGGSYGEAALILCSVLSALAAATWKGERIDRKRFVEVLQRYAPSSLHTTRVSVPLLIGALRKAGRAAEMAAIETTFMRHDDSRVLTGKEVDRDEAEILAACSTIPAKLLRESSYANVLYCEVRSGYAHEYRPGERADSWPMTGKADATISYVNWVNDRDRHIHFHVPWLALLAGSVAEALDPIADRLPLARPSKWWVDG